MGAVWMIVCSRWRRGIGMHILLAVTIALVGAAVLGTVAGARRTSTSFSRFVDASAVPDAVIELGPVEERFTEAQLAEVIDLPQVAGSARLVAFAMSPQAQNVFQPIGGMIDDGFGIEVARPRYVAGRAPVAADEVSMDEPRAAKLGLELGDTVTMTSYTPEDLQQFASGTIPEPNGPLIELRLVGIERTPASVSTAQELARITTLPKAFTEKYRGTVGEWSEFIFVDLADDDAEGFTRAVHAIDGLENLPIDPAGSDAGGSAAVSGDFVARALMVLAAIMALAGIAVLYVLVRRLVATAGVDDDALSAIGFDRRLRAHATLLEVTPAAGAGVVGAAVGALLASSRFPFGLAGRAEPDPGLDVDAAILVLGLLALVAVVAAITALAARAARGESVAPSDGRSSRMVEALTAMGAPWPLVTSGRLVLTRGRRRAAVRAAVSGVAIGTAGLTAAVIFASSQSSLEQTPTRWGATWDVQINDSTLDDVDVPEPAELNHVHVVQLEINGHLAEVRSFDSRGDAPMMAVSSGRQAGPGEIILGARTMQELGVSIGDRVTVTGGLGSDELAVVGTGVFNGVVDVPVLNIGAAVLSQSLAEVSDPQNDDGFDTVLVRAGSEAQLAELIAGVAEAEGLSDAEAALGLTPQPPDELDRLAEVRSLPWVLAGFLGLLAVLATTALLVNSVRRQRRDLAVLRTQGLDALGVHQIVAWQAVAVSVLGLLIGLPLGIIIGRLVWTAVASDIGVIVSTSIPWQALAATVLVVLLVDVGTSFVPARRAARSRPADTLRSE